MTNGKRIAVIGSGSWATAIVKILSNNASKVNWYFRNQSDIDHMNQYGHNPRYLSSVQFDLNKLHLSSNLLETLTQADIIILAVPSAFINNTIKDIPANVFGGKTVFSAIKGIVPEYNLIVGRIFKYCISSSFRKHWCDYWSLSRRRSSAREIIVFNFGLQRY
jgi:glycerol-3-phosphate dehydrogenase (NAD(P)+)